MQKLLLRADVAEKLALLYRNAKPPTADDLLRFSAARAARAPLAAKLEGARAAASSDPENYAVVGDTAQIEVTGVLSEEPDFWAWIFGMDGSTYEDIRDGLALAAADPAVKKVVFAISSPGGYVDGLFETLAAIESFPKDKTVQAAEAQSAAYAIAAVAGPITAVGPASSFGSVGVAIDYVFDSSAEYVSITSTEAPNKRPDPRTAEGKAVVVAELDAIHELFVDAIARGRSKATGKTFDVAQVNSDFGRGATMLAQAAKTAGMIDKTPRAPKSGASAQTDPSGSPAAEQQPLPVAAPSPESGQKKKIMSAENLKISDPATYSEVIALGVAQERKRVAALLKLGEKTGAMKVATDAIASGASCMDEEVHAEFLSASINRRDVNDRQADSDAAGNAIGSAATSTAPAEPEEDLGDQIWKRFEANGRKPKK